MNEAENAAENMSKSVTKISEKTLEATYSNMNFLSNTMNYGSGAMEAYLKNYGKLIEKVLFTAGDNDTTAGTVSRTKEEYDKNFIDYYGWREVFPVGRKQFEAVREQIYISYNLRTGLYDRCVFCGQIYLDFSLERRRLYADRIMKEKEDYETRVWHR